ncbi:DUF4180 domain-containing protein [Paenibacillus sp. sgz500958]|uniref:DUF4180 domain-containing protein n=1 Tax=Paenibacillus sp. sgz500958 TaxID=3242475 RepID=UPI0036D34610
MRITTVINNNIEVAKVESQELLITDVQSALDLLATVQYETGCNRFILSRSAICEDFFQLKTRLAGEVLQKFINYQVKVAIVGDFSMFTSENLKDFMYECNKGKDFFFLTTEEQAIDKLSSAV